MTIIPYLEQLSSESKNKFDINNIENAIKENGFWESKDEWRIFTVTEKKIEKISRDNKLWYKVIVKCDSEHICHCPTIDRAIEFLNIFDGIIRGLFFTVGWPSWPAKSNNKSNRNRKKH